MYSVCMCYIMGYGQYCYVFVSDGMADDVLFVVIVAVKAFMVQLLSPRQISLNGTIKYIVSYRIVSYRIVSYRTSVLHLSPLLQLALSPPLPSPLPPPQTFNLVFLSLTS